MCDFEGVFSFNCRERSEKNLYLIAKHRSVETKDNIFLIQIPYSIGYDRV